MAGRASITVNRRQLADLKAKCSPDIYRKQVEKVVEATADIAFDSARSRAPRAGGKLLGSVKKERGHLRPVRYIKITASATSGGRKGFRYGMALDAAKRIAYRMHGTGKKTFGWFSGVKRGMASQVRALVMQAEHGVKREWDR